MIKPTLIRPSACGVIVCSRSKATGDNSQPYVPTKPAEPISPDVLNDTWGIETPPSLPTIQEVLVESLDEIKRGSPIEDDYKTWFGKSMPTINDDKDPARDLVNFPRPKPEIYPEGTRLFLLPDSWFRALYPKLGVTGPYTLTFGLLSFLLSKEYLVYEEEMHIGLSMCIVIGYAIHKFGPQVHKSVQNATDSTDWYWYEWRQDAIARLKEYIDTIKKNQSSLDGQGILFEAKRENLALQAEAEYRRRLVAVHNEVKRKLDYQVASDQARQQFEKNHMVSWILKSVEDAVSRQSDKEILTKCIGDLKALSLARKGAI